MSDPITIGGAKNPVIARVCALAKPIIEGHGLILVGAEWAQEGRHKILWIYIDRPECAEDAGEGEQTPAIRGVTIEDCAQVSPEVSAALDVEDPIAEAYELRISSPGLDRPLMNDADFRRFCGREAQLHLTAPVSGRKKLTGKIGEVVGDSVHILCSDGDFTVNFSAIHKARLRFEVSIGKLDR